VARGLTPFRRQRVTAMLQGVTTAEAPEARPQETTTRRRRWVPWAALATAVLAVAGYGLWWLVWSTPIRDHGGYGVGFQDVEPGASRTIALGPFCLDGGGSATIDAVTLDRAVLPVVGDGDAVGGEPDARHAG